MTNIRNDVIIRPSKTTREKQKTKNKKENHSIHSIDAHEGWRKEKVIPVGT